MKSTIKLLLLSGILAGSAACTDLDTEINTYYFAFPLKTPRVGQSEIAAYIYPFSLKNGSAYIRHHPAPPKNASGINIGINKCPAVSLWLSKCYQIYCTKIRTFNSRGFVKAPTMKIVETIPSLQQSKSNDIMVVYLSKWEVVLDVSAYEGRQNRIYFSGHQTRLAYPLSQHLL